MSKPQLSEAQKQELLDFFTLECSALRRQLKLIFKIAAFESDIAANQGGKNALFSLYHIIEIIDENGDENCNG